jgi:predicted phage terminase large subunit-like protein
VLVRRSDVPWRYLRPVRAWDLAATEASKDNRDPDYTASCLMGVADGEFYICHVTKGRYTPAVLDDLLASTWEADLVIFGPHEIAVPVRLEREGGSSGKIAIHKISVGLRSRGCDVAGLSPRESKVARAEPLSKMAERGFVHLVEGPWNDDYLDELELFPTEGVHDDQVDASSLAFRFLTRGDSASFAPVAVEKPEADGDDPWAGLTTTEFAVVDSPGWGAV